MKINRIAWEKNKKRSLFYAWPMAISTLLQIFVVPAIVNTSSTLALLTPWLALLVFAPFAYVDARRQRKSTAQEKRELQDKYDAEDQAMFGKPLRELEL